MIMRRSGPTVPRSPQVRTSGFTLPEVVICVFVMMVLFAGIITTYMQGAYRAEWSGFSLAAQSAALQQLESAKCAVWDPLQSPVKDEIRSLTNISSVLLDLPVSGTNYVYATNYPSIVLLKNGAYSNYMLKVDTVWPFRWRDKVTLYTNTVACYYAPD
jgi:hypothetical protein